MDSTFDKHTPGTGAGVPVTIIDTGAAAPGVSGDREVCFFHGTAVASVIRTLAPGAPVRSLRHSDDPERMDGTVATLVEALDQAISDRDGPAAKLINISMVACQDTVELRESVVRAQEAGALVIASTGNSGQCEEGQIPYPAALPGVLAVGAVDSLDPDNPEVGRLPASYSAGSNFADIFATGGPVSAEFERSPGQVQTVVGTPNPFVGTSFATPVVTATAARVWQILPQASASQVHDILVDSAVPGGAIHHGDRPVQVLDSQAAVNLALNLASGSAGTHATRGTIAPAVTTEPSHPADPNYSVPVAIALVFALVAVVVMVRRAMDSLKSPASGRPLINRQGTSTGSAKPSAFNSDRVPTE